MTDTENRWLSWKTERTALQIIVALGSLVPILAGGAGMIDGLATLGGGQGITSISLDSHFRYLSGLLLAIGLGYLSTIPQIETRERRFRLLTALVVVGGLGRLSGLILAGIPSAGMLAALGMELAVAPLLAFWQARVAHHVAGTHSAVSTLNSPVRNDH